MYLNMKLLFENWRKHLNEADPYAETGVKTKFAKPKSSEIEPDEYSSPYEHEETDEETREKYFGKDPNDLLCIKRLKDPKDYLSPANFYKCMDDAGYEKISGGSFRWVFDHPDDPSLVFKMVAPNHFLENPDLKGAAVKRAMEMNRKEATGAFQTTSELVPKVYDSAKDYFWIISEKVTPIETWRELQTHFPAWKEEGAEEFMWWFQKLISPDTIPEVAIEQLDRRIEYAKMGEELVNDPLILNIRDLLAQFDLPAWDIRPHNVGYATRNGKKQFVILDPGFELAPDTKESQPEDSKAFSDLFKDKYAVTAPQKPNIMENWRHLAKESRGPKEFHYKITQSTKKIVIQPLNLQTKEPEPGKAKGNAEIVLEKRTDVPHWQVTWSNSPLGTEGVGKIMYLMALELAGNDGLSPDDYEQSDDASRVWAKFMPEKNGLGVSKQKKEEFMYEGDNKPFFFVFFKPQDTILNRFFKQISYEQGREEEKPQMEPEERPYDPEKDLDDLYDLGVLQEEEPFQKKVKRKHRRMKFRLIGKGKNKHNVGKKMKKPSYKRSKSAPPGAGGS